MISLFELEISNSPQILQRKTHLTFCWTEPRKPVLSMTEMDWRQQGRQSEAQGLFISITRGPSSDSAVKFMLKTLLMGDDESIWCLRNPCLCCDCICWCCHSDCASRRAFTMN